eukprot:gene8455-5932_t
MDVFPSYACDSRPDPLVLFPLRFHLEVRVSSLFLLWPTFSFHDIAVDAAARAAHTTSTSESKKHKYLSVGESNTKFVQIGCSRLQEKSVLIVHLYLRHRDILSDSAVSLLRNMNPFSGSDPVVMEVLPPPSTPGAGTSGDLVPGIAQVLPTSDGTEALDEPHGIYVGVRLRPTTDASEPVAQRIIANTLDNVIECPASVTPAGIRDDAGANRSSAAAVGHTASGARRVFDFTYDKVLNHLADQRDVMAAVGDVAVDRVLAGFNGTVLCYGQSGSGKTHTMIGSSGGRLENFYCDSATGQWNWSEEVGLLPRMLHSLFQKLVAKHGPATDEADPTTGVWTVELSALELYNEELRDLIPGTLVPATSSKLSRLASQVPTADMGEEDEPIPRPPPTPRSTKSPQSASMRRPSFASKASTTSPMSAVEPVTLRIRQSAPNDAMGMTVWVEGLRRHRVPDFTAAMAAVHQALHERKVSGTRLNARSNRSHTLFLVSVCQREAQTVSGTDAEPVVQVKRSVLTLVDLAGSERVSQTGAEGQQLIEAQRINLSLTLLGNVIRRLTEGGAKGKSHIPYRDSKLTRILQDSFGGNAVTYLLCNISPEERNRSETLSTLRFAQVAKKVRNRATVNAFISSGSVEEQLKQAFDYIAWLENQLRAVTLKEEGSLTATRSPGLDLAAGSPSASLQFVQGLFPPGPSETVPECLLSPLAPHPADRFTHRVASDRPTAAEQADPKPYEAATASATPVPADPPADADLAAEESDAPGSSAIAGDPPADADLAAEESDAPGSSAIAGDPPADADLAAEESDVPRSSAIAGDPPADADLAAEESDAPGSSAIAGDPPADADLVAEESDAPGSSAIAGDPPADADLAAEESDAPGDTPPPPFSLPAMDLLEDTQQFLQSYGFSTPLSAAAESYRRHPLATSSTTILAQQHELTADGAAWNDDDMEMDFTQAAVGKQRQHKRSALQRMMDAIKLAAAIAKGPEEPHSDILSFTNVYINGIDLASMGLHATPFVLVTPQRSAFSFRALSDCACPPDVCTMQRMEIFNRSEEPPTLRETPCRDPTDPAPSSPPSLWSVSLRSLSLLCPGQAWGEGVDSTARSFTAIRRLFSGSDEETAEETATTTAGGLAAYRRPASPRHRRPAALPCVRSPSQRHTPSRRPRSPEKSSSQRTAAVSPVTPQWHVDLRPPLPAYDDPLIVGLRPASASVAPGSRPSSARRRLDIPSLAKRSSSAAQSPCRADGQARCSGAQGPSPSPSILRRTAALHVEQLYSPRRYARHRSGTPPPAPFSTVCKAGERCERRGTAPAPAPAPAPAHTATSTSTIAHPGARYCRIASTSSRHAPGPAGSLLSRLLGSSAPSQVVRGRVVVPPQRHTSSAGSQQVPPGRGLRRAAEERMKLQFFSMTAASATHASPHYLLAFLFSSKLAKRKTFSLMQVLRSRQRPLLRLRTTVAAAASRIGVRAFTATSVLRAGVNAPPSLRSTLPPSATELPESSFLKCIEKEIMDEKLRLDKEDGPPPVPADWTFFHPEGTSLIYGRRFWVPPLSEGSCGRPRPSELHFVRAQLTTRDPSLDPECDVRGEHFPFSFFVQVRRDASSQRSDDVAAPEIDLLELFEGQTQSLFEDSIEVRCDLIDGELRTEHVLVHGPVNPRGTAESTPLARLVEGYLGPALIEQEEDVLDGLQAWLAERRVDDIFAEFIGSYSVWVEQMEYERWLKHLRNYVAA